MDIARVFFLILAVWGAPCGYRSVSETAARRIPSEPNEVGNDKPFPLAAEKQEVYRLVLNEKRFSASGEKNFLLDRTAFSATGPTSLGEVLKARSAISKQWNKTVASLGTDLRESFLSENERPSSFPVSSDLKDNFTMISQTEITPILKGVNGWAEFHRRFGPGSIVEVSQIGFNKDRSEALVYLSRSAGLKNGEGNYYWLNRVNDRWSVKEVINAWIS